MVKHYQKVMSASDVRIYNEEDTDRIETAIHTNEDRSYNKRFTMRELICRLIKHMEKMRFIIYLSEI